MIEIYCKKTHKQNDSITYEKYKTYWVRKSQLDHDGAKYVKFIETGDYGGFWFSNSEFNETFSIDKKFIRQEKLERICNV